MNTQKLKLEEAISNQEEYIKNMMKMDEKKLLKNIDLYQQQMEMAYQQGNYETVALLQEYEMQTIIATSVIETSKHKKSKKLQP